MGMFNYRVRFHGFTAHAGTFPMAKRHDALHAAAEFLCKLHERYDAYNKELLESGESEYEFVFTTGEIYVHPCIHTCIPDEAEFSLDVRHPDQKVLDKCMDILKEMAGEMYQQCTCDIEEQWKRDPVPFDSRLIGFVEESMDEMGAKWQKILSGAGHDAQFCAYMIPTTMIFSRTKDGLSHCEPEHVSDEDCTAAATATLNAVLKCDASPEF
jgi:N-carbamoyl-L-amino-acid hydrolase